MNPTLAQAATPTCILDQITSPQDLRDLSFEELDELSAEIRSLLVTSVAASGGHLGSNLGAVELTVALHRSFSSPVDSLIWDTGHQAYVHKMLTGRCDAFSELRQPGGLSGYPNRAESPHDIVENSHASTALGYAYGVATARRHSGTEGHVVAVVGDGSLTGGVAYEALNNIGFTQLPVVVVLNDNGRSYAPTVSKLCGPDGTAADFFSSLGFDYVDPTDGHDIAALEVALTQSATSSRPIVVHVLTQKGRGYRPAEDDVVKCMHDTSPFNPNTGASLASKQRTFSHAFAESMLELGAVHDNLFAITAAMPSSTGLHTYAQRFPNRFIDVGIAEQQAVTAAAGLAMEGCRPVVALYSTFLSRAWDQIYYDVGLHELPVIFCIDRAGITGDDGASHHGVLDMALMTKVPGMTVLAASSDQEVDAMLRYALSLDGPVSIRWPKGAAPQVDADEVGHGCRARLLREAADVCLLAVGKMVGVAAEAAEALNRRGIGASVWDVRSLRPLDPEMLAHAASHDTVVTIEDGVREGGVGGHIAAALADTESPPSTVRALGTPTDYLPHGRVGDILKTLGLDAPSVAATTAELVTGKSSVVFPFPAVGPR